MNETDRPAVIHHYVKQVSTQMLTGHATEHSYRPALKDLLGALDDSIEAINEPKQSEHGAPDFVIIGKKNKDVKLGYGEAKIPGENLDKIEKSDQMNRYRGYGNLFLTDCFDWRFYRNGEKVFEIKIGDAKRGENQAAALYADNYSQLADEIANFLSQTPEKIRSGRRLAQIMGGKARRIRDNVVQYLAEDAGNSAELLKIYEMMKKLLVHDLSEEKFADMYAQTLVYGLFVARYGDKTPESFTRTEARDLVPKSNPFLRHFFDHIVGPNFDVRLGYIVDELCEVFSVSNVQEIVHKHLRIQDQSSDAKDPIIHFYEDFLHEYDPAERKRMGAYYTPIPVVKYIVRQVDKILKEDFGIAKGLASEETIDHWIETGQDHRADKRKKLATGYNVKIPRVQVLDPAVGTATFLNETIKFIYEGFKGQEGRWPSYVNDNLVKRLHGFELMMAPYTIAHLKLGMTLKETGVNQLNDRLGVYLTNTLEEGVPMQQDIFSFGLAEAVSEESRHAADIKSNHPVMVVMGNPPYSVSSNNKSKWIESLVAEYKKDLNERNIQPLSDDYIKFIRFAEEMITKNGSGVVAMITNNSYIDGLIHRQMRKHLLHTFDKIYVLDLHGNTKKKEVAPDGRKDVNVFDIQQGVSIILGVKTGGKQAELADVYHAELFGARKAKFDDLNDDAPNFNKIDVTAPGYYFLRKDTRLQSEYDQFIGIRDLMPLSSSGVQTKRDLLFVDADRREVSSRIQKLIENNIDDNFIATYNIHDSTGYNLKSRISNAKYDESKIAEYNVRPFDYQFIYYDENLIGRAFHKVMQHMQHDNLALTVSRQFHDDFKYVLVADKVTDINYIAGAGKFGGGYTFPLYIYHVDGTRTPNLAPAELSALFRNMPYLLEDLHDGKKDTGAPETVTPESVLDYVYAVLHSPSYRAKYKEFLKTDFPRVPAPKDAIEYWNKSHLGRELRELHLMKSPVLDDYVTTFPESGDNIVEKLRYEDERVYINDTQYFGNVPETAWNFYIGGYQPAQKWLKDRKGRQLTADDLNHYQKIIKVLCETDRIMKEIGEAI